MFICFLAACQSTPEITTMSVPTSTQVPETPTATAIPPTEIPTPTATVVPEIQGIFDINYIDDGKSEHQLDLFLPPSSDSPRLTIFAIGNLQFELSGKFRYVNRKKLRDFARHFANLGYPVVVIGYTYPSEPYAEQTTKDALCALAWVHANAGKYNFDPERIIVYGHVIDAAIAAKLGIVDDSADYLVGCPHKSPSHKPANIITYGGVFFDPTDSLPTPGYYITPWLIWHHLDEEMTVEDGTEIFTQLSEIPPHEWRINPALKAQSRKIAELLPTYQLDGSEPGFFLLAGEVSIFESLSPYYGVIPGSPHSDRFFEQLQAVGVEVSLHRLENVDTVSARESERMATVFEAIEVYLSERFP
jgi:acetyl esterase/lipase